MPDPVASSLLTVFLADQDQPCPQCEYNLRNLQGTRCPECGEELVLRVNMVEPRQRLLITGLIGLSAGAGLNGLLLIYGLIQLIQRPYFSGDGRFWILCGVGLLIEGGALIAWLLLWRPIRRKSTSMRAILAACCWLLKLLDIVIFSLSIK
jgi:hypothetical protein